MITFKHILCPVDFSKISNNALDNANELVEQLNASLHLLHVYQHPSYTIPEMDIASSIELAAQDDVKERLQKQLTELEEKVSKPGLHLKSTLIEGIPHLEILEVAKEINADMIIMGTHGREGFAHMLLGSVTERVVRMANIPVLSVPYKEDN